MGDRPYALMTPAERFARKSKAMARMRVRILAASDVCHLCGRHGADTIDHVHPLSRGGTNELDILNPAHGRKSPGCTGNYGKRDAMPSMTVVSRNW